MALADGGWNLVTQDDKGAPYGLGKYVESEDSGGFDMSPDDAHAEMVYLVDDKYRLGFCDSLYGLSTYANENGGNYTINRILPEQHPEWVNFYCTNIKGRRVGIPGIQQVAGVNAGTWTVCRVEADFRPVGYAVLKDNEIGSITYTSPIDNKNYTAPNEILRYTSRTYNYVIQQLTVQGLMQFVTRTTNKPLDTAPGQTIIMTELELTWHQVPARQVAYSMFEPPNQATAVALGGCVNSATFDGHPAGTVLFSGYKPVLRKPNLQTGLYMWDINYRFLIQDHGYSTTFSQEIGQQFIYDTLNSRWDLVTANGTATGPKLYPLGDLNALFAIQSNG